MQSIIGLSRSLILKLLKVKKSWVKSPLFIKTILSEKQG